MGFREGRLGRAMRPHTRVARSSPRSSRRMEPRGFGIVAFPATVIVSRTCSVWSWAQPEYAVLQYFTILRAPTLDARKTRETVQNREIVARFFRLLQ